MGKAFTFHETAECKFLGEFVYLPVEICHRWTLLRAPPVFRSENNFENWQKRQRRLSAWVGQADFGKLELNNRNHCGNSQWNLINLKHVDQFEINAAEFSDLRAFVNGRGCYYPSLFQGEEFHTLIILRQVFYWNPLLRANQFPSTQASTSLACYSPSRMHSLQASTIVFLLYLRHPPKTGM